jgi:hypothetical protein
LCNMHNRTMENIGYYTCRHRTLQLVNLIQSFQELMKMYSYFVSIIILAVLVLVLKIENLEPVWAAAEDLER